MTSARPARRGRVRGQSMAEMALIMPVMLALTLGSVDLARVYQAWVSLQSATRNAAEYAASNTLSPTAASTAARRVACLEMAGVPGYVAGATPESCHGPIVTLTSFTVEDSNVATSIGSPVVTARVESALEFRTLFPYPFITNDGAWTLTVRETYSVAQVP